MKKILSLALICLAMLSSCKNGGNTNPLLEKSPYPFEAVPFDKIKDSDFLPAFKVAFEEAKQEIKAVIHNPDSPSFSNTILDLHYTGQRLGNLTSLFTNYYELHTSKEMDETYSEVIPMLKGLSQYIVHNDTLFERIKFVHDHVDDLSLNKEDSRLLELTYEYFVKNGANLSDRDKNRLRTIKKELAQASYDFSKNLYAATEASAINILDSAELAGLPAGFIKEAAHDAHIRNKSGWLIFLKSDYVKIVLSKSSNRNLRERVWRSYNSRAYNGNFDNQENVKKIVALRLEYAKLMGYDCFADMELKHHLANSPEKVSYFLNTLLEKIKPIAKNDVNEIYKYAVAHGFQEDNLKPWDLTYYADLIKNEKYAVSDEEVMPYFELDNTILGIGLLAQSLYGIKQIPLDNIPVYDPDVKVYEVVDVNGRHLALVYADLYSRPGKSDGIWMTSFREQNFSRDGLTEQRPFIAVVANFEKPKDGSPVLLNYYQFTQLLHVFGHSLQSMFAEGKYLKMCGTNVAPDFIELSSTLLERWGADEEFLSIFATHYKTGETIPKSLIDKINAQITFNSAFTSVRQLSFGILDQAWHSVKEMPQESVAEFENRALKNTFLTEKSDGAMFSTAFSQIFSGPNAATYYAFKLAKVMEYDIFEYFKTNGIFSRKPGDRFREEILSKGRTTDDPDVLYRNFLGRDPDPTAYLNAIR